MPKTTTKKPPRDLLTLRATDGRRVQVQARQIRAVTPSATGAGHAHIELYKGGRSHIVQADPAELAAQVASLRPRSRMAKETDPPNVFEYSLRSQHLTLRETDVLAVGNGIPRRRRQSQKTSPPHRAA